MIGSRSAILLCGGQSQRMGEPKALLSFCGEPLLLRVHRVLANVVDSVIVVAAPGQELPELPPDTRVIHDQAPGEGPLVAVASAVPHLPKASTHVFLVGCDYPFLTETLIEMMMARVGERNACALAGPRPQPLCAWYRSNCLRDAVTLVAQGERRLTAMYERLGPREIEPQSLYPGAEKAVRNVNTPEAYRMAKAEIEETET